MWWWRREAIVAGLRCLSPARARFQLGVSQVVRGKRDAVSSQIQRNVYPCFAETKVSSLFLLRDGNLFVKNEYSGDKVVNVTIPG